MHYAKEPYLFGLKRRHTDLITAEFILKLLPNYDKIHKASCSLIIILKNALISYALTSNYFTVIPPNKKVPIPLSFLSH